MEIQLSNGQTALVDEEDYELVSQWKWQMHDQGYACRKYRSQEAGKKWGRMFMHRLIMDAQPGEEVDHINRNKLDNRRENLRIVPHYVNTHNRNSGSGVHKPKGRNRWKAIIYINGQRHWLGSFETEAEAQAAYDKAKQEAGLVPGKLWGTPTSRDHKDTGSMENVPVNGLLGRQVLTPERMWPTPDTPSGGRAMPEGTTPTGMTPDGRKVTVGLANAVKLWPTPHSKASTGAGTQGREGGENLQTAVQMYGTPRAIYGEYAGMSDPSHLTGQAGATGNLKLNSAWVSRMMGYPDGWLILDGEETR